MRKVPTNKILMKKYGLSKDKLFEIMNECLNYYLSEEELEVFINEYYFKLEKRRNKRYVK